MNVKTLILCLLPITATAQSFAGLGADAEGFPTTAPNYTFAFPTDHGAHNDYRIEWWYLTANLQDAAGTDYGLQWTLFRSALAPTTGDDWTSPHIWMGHAAVTTPDQHYVSERFGRGGIGQAGVTADPFEAWIDDWTLTGDWTTLDMTASGSNFAYDMTMTAQGPLVFHGDAGYSVKSASGRASYYYSQPFFDIAGTLQLPTGEVSVSGTAWLDREWSSRPLADNQQGWNWFGLSLDDGTKLMVGGLRQTDGIHYTFGTWIAADGTTTPYGDGFFTATPLATNAEDVPVRWRVELPVRNLDVTVDAINENAWMATSVPYWEGPVTVSGSHNGVGYLEMTGYE